MELKKEVELPAPTVQRCRVREMTASLVYFVSSSCLPLLKIRTSFEHFWTPSRIGRIKPFPEHPTGKLPKPLEHFLKCLIYFGPKIGF